MHWLTLVSCLLSSALWASESLVFLRETPQGRHVVLKTGNTETTLTRSKNWHLSPDLSSDGKKVVWAEGASEKNLSVVVYDVATKTRDKFELSRRGPHSQPRFSRNGKLIFFSGAAGLGSKIMFFEPEHSRTRLARTESDGTRVFRLEPQTLAHDGSGFFPRPSTTGDFLVFQRTSLLKREIVEYDFRTKTTRVLAEGTAPALSFDENWVAYASKENGSWDIWIVHRLSGDKVALTDDGKDELAPSFTPTGQVVFASNRTGNFQLYKLSQGDWLQLTTSAADDTDPQVSGEAAWQLSLSATLPAPARSSFGALTLDGKIYVCGGHHGAQHSYPPEAFSDQLQVFDPKLGRWSSLAPRPHRAQSFQLAAFGKFIYAFGGFAFDDKNSPKWKSLDVIDRYDTETNTWESIGRMPRARSSHQAVKVGTKVYLIGGWDATAKTPGDREGTFHSAVDVFDLATEMVTTARWELPQPLRRAFSAVGHRGNILLVGGLGTGATHSELLNHVTLIEPTSGFHKELPVLPVATFAPAAGILGDELLVFGGVQRPGAREPGPVSHIYSMNLSTQKWRHTGRYLSEPKGFSQVAELEGGLVVIGGQRSSADGDEPAATVEVIRK